MSAQAATAESFNSPLNACMAIHTRLDELLEQKEKSLYWLQKETGISYSALHKLRKDRARSMDYEVLEKICAVLDCEPGDLIVRVADEPKSKRKG
jgi:putative transcriptional regulator